MLLLQTATPEFSILKAVVVLAIVIGVSVFVIVFLELFLTGSDEEVVVPEEPVYYYDFDRPDGSAMVTTDKELFNQIEEYRDDFPEAR